MHNREDISNTYLVNGNVVFEYTKPEVISNTLLWNNQSRRFEWSANKNNFYTFVTKIMKSIEAAHIYHEEVDYADPNMCPKFEEVGREKMLLVIP